MTSGCEVDPERLYSLFLDLVRIDSVSRFEQSASRYIRGFFSDLGIECIEDDAGEKTGGGSGNLIARIDPRCADPGETLVLNAHFDTVEPGRGIVPVRGEDRFSSAGETILGADDKAGIAAILATAEALVRDGAARRPVEVVLTVQEELGLAGVKQMDLSQVGGRAGLVLDGSGKVGGIVTEAPSHEMMWFALKGRAAHAGVEPEKGVSAIACAADAIAGLDLGRLDEGTTANIGMIKGGRAMNIVPDTAEVAGEIRSLSDERLSAEALKMFEAFREAAARHGCELEHERMRSFQHYRIDRDSPHLREVTAAMRDCGVDPFFITSGGGSDANVFNAAGMQMLNINIGIEDAHSLCESVNMSDMLAVTRLMLRLATGGADPGPGGSGGRT